MPTKLNKKLSALERIPKTPSVLVGSPIATQHFWLESLQKALPSDSVAAQDVLQLPEMALQLESAASTCFVNGKKLINKMIKKNKFIFKLFFI